MTTENIALTIAGSSTFGRYPKINAEKTYNMFVSQDFLVPYAGYKIAISKTAFEVFAVAEEGRGVYYSAKFKKIVAVISSGVYLLDLNYSKQLNKITSYDIIFLGLLQTNTGAVYIAENNKPQIAICDGLYIYLYDPTLTPAFFVVNVDFVPNYITFHDTYFIAGAADTDIWRLSESNNGASWPYDRFHVGALETKSDNLRAVTRFPSRGNMIFVMGETVTESWFDTGAQLFPYQRNNQFNIDYGCLSAATVAAMDEIVVWLAQNEKSGPIIVYSNGGVPQKITTDGIDFLFSQLQKPEDSQAFLYRQDGHLFYHINFYYDNLILYCIFIHFVLMMIFSSFLTFLLLIVFMYILNL